MADYEDRYDLEDDEEYVSWITWFCELKGNEFFCMVDREFIADDFNLTGLSSMVTFYQYALDVIQDLDTLDSDRFTEEQKRLVESSAETLYGLIHARFITTNRGLALMEEKFTQGEFGCCPRVFCSGQAVLPVGQSDVVRESSVKLFCPKCEDIYYPRSYRHKTLDGAFWGTTFPHLLLLQMKENGSEIVKSSQQYVPRIYGFRIRKPGSPLPAVHDQQGTDAGAAGGSAGADRSTGAAGCTNAGSNGVHNEENDNRNDPAVYAEVLGAARYSSASRGPQAAAASGKSIATSNGNTNNSRTEQQEQQRHQDPNEENAAEAAACVGNDTLNIETNSHNQPG